MTSDSRGSRLRLFGAGGLSLLLATLSACSLRAPFVRVRVDMPTPAAIRIEDYREIVLAGFHVAEPASDVDLDRDLTAFFETEFSARVTAAVSVRRLIPDDETLLTKEDFWKGAAGEGANILFLTGKARFDQELRKAFLRADRGRGESPFTEDKIWDERRSFTLEATVRLVDGTTGRPVFEKDYKETANYANVRQPSSFALFDVLQRLKVKFFRDAIGAERIQERYLLYDE